MNSKIKNHLYGCRANTKVYATCYDPVFVQVKTAIRSERKGTRMGSESFKDKGTTGTKKGSIFMFSSWIEMDLNCNSSFAV